MNKLCPGCQQSKDTSEFAFKNKSKGTLSTQCKSCHNEYAKNHYLKNKKYYKKKALKSGRKQRQIRKVVLDELREQGCSYCPETEPCCLEFHHKDPKQKSFTVSNATSLATLKKELKKCVLTCANCHRKIHAGKLNVI